MQICIAVKITVRGVCVCVSMYIYILSDKKQSDLNTLKYIQHVKRNIFVLYC